MQPSGDGSLIEIDISSRDKQIIQGFLAISASGAKDAHALALTEEVNTADQTFFLASGAMHQVDLPTLVLDMHVFAHLERKDRGYGRLVIQECGTVLGWIAAALKIQMLSFMHACMKEQATRHAGVDDKRQFCKLPRLGIPLGMLGSHGQPRPFAS